ncbi:MAG TPA: glycosyltransferase family 4 protein [Streptosporangiaceae bacterium]|nr:glycosyltransferase family 4 protein [Streptosporangiaceae bacterium]
MRIALIGPAHPYKGGGARHTTELAHRLAAAGHEVVIESWRAMYPAALYPGVQTVQEAEGEPYPLTRRLLSWRRPDGWRRAGRRLRKSCDMAVFTFLAPVQVPAYITIIRGLRSRVAPGPRVVVICHNVLPHERRPGDVMLTRALLRRADAVLTHTERLARAALDLAPDTPVRVAGMPPHLPAVPGRGDTVRPAAPLADGPRPDYRESDGRESDGREPDGREPDGREPDGRQSDARQPDGPGLPAACAEPVPAGRLSPAPLHLLFFGIVRPYKGLDVLLRAIARTDCGPTLTLTVAGEFWGGLDTTRALVSELGLDGRVELRPGYVPAGEIGPLLGRADALVLPYRCATASQNAWLAFSAGVPVIATRTGTFEEQVSDGVDGFLCEPGDEASLAAALARLCEPGVAARLRAGVRAVVPDALWEAYLDALLAAAAPGPPPGWTGATTN